MLRSSVLVLCGLSCLALSGEEIGVTVERFGDASRTVRNDSGVIELHGPASLRLTPRSTVSDGEWVLELDYFSLGGVQKVTARVGPIYDRTLNQSLPPLGHRETFSPYVARLGPRASQGLSASNDLRIDMQMPADAMLQIRNVRLRRERVGEFRATGPLSDSSADSDAIEAYLSRSFESAISSVSVGPAEINITGVISGAGDPVFLGDIPMETLLTEKKPFHSLVRVDVLEDGKFDVVVPRVASRDGRSVDRLTSRWQLYHKQADGHVAISHARYADDVACRLPIPPAVRPASKKGLGGWSSRDDPELSGELQSLGISAVTVNLFALHQYVSPRPKRDSIPFEWQGRTYYASESRLRRLDRTFREAEEAGVMVSVILLLSNPSHSTDADVQLLGHPDAVRDGKYAMPNVTSTEGIAYYGAILDLMAKRWSRSDGVHGRVHHWIVHNEVDFGWVWTNAGHKTDIEYMDLYQRSMRLVDLIARQYDPNARAWITLTHHWADRGNEHGYGSKRMLELLARYCQAEGDFPWALAHHPYPQSLFNPRTWEDKQATFTLDAAKITPKNIEVLDAYMRLPKMRYRGKVRPIHLSENGFNSKDYSPQAMEDQAAGMALAWNKIKGLPSIESWQYHNWIDNRQEGGLRIGLRKFRDDATDPLGKKPIWHLYQALGTPQEDAVARPYLKTIGIRSWDDIMHRDRIH